MRKGFLPLIIMLCVCIVGFFGCQQKNDVEKAELTVYSTNIELYENDTHQIKYDYTGKNSVQFTSNDDSVVTVNSKGLVTAVGVGTAFVDVNAGDINKLISIKVVDQQISVALDKENISVAKNSEQYITANVLVGSDLISSGIEWTVSSNDLTLTSNGCVAKIKSAKTGYYSITATYKNISATCSVKVVENSAVKLETPVVTVSNCDTITWNAVANAESYQIKVNDGNWIDVDGSSYSIKDVSDVLKKGDSTEVYVKAVAKDNFSVIDSNHRYVEVSHDFTETAVTSYDCVNEGTVKFTCEDCGREYVQEKYSKGHNFIDGVCLDCDALQVPGITYEYHEETNSYWVKSATGSVTPEVTFVAGTYDDGTHGKLPVTHIGQNAFKGNTIIEKVYLPMSVTTIYPGAFESCTNLYFISMTGVKEIDGFNSQANHFLGDFKLRIAIVSAGFTLKTQVFNDYYAPNYVPILDFYVTSLGTITAKHSSQNSMISDVIYYYDGTGTACNSWKYGKDGDVVVNYSHSYGRVDERFECVKCGEFYDEVFEYEYDENTNSYGVKGFKGEGREEVVGILTEYNDGVHGILPVTKIGRGAFSGNTSLIRAILPDTITQLTNNTFGECINLVYVAMPGVVHNEYALTGGNHFINCTKLKTVVLGESFYTNCQMFFANPGPADSAVTDIYLSSKDGKFVAEGNQDLLTGNVYYYDETGKTCGTWSYNEDRTDIILNGSHIYTNGVCTKCGAYESKDMIFGYDLEKNSYFVSAYTGSAKEVTVLSEFSDGIHGVLPVTTIGKRAFRQNTTITKVILPESVKKIQSAAFSGCTNLVYVDARGVTELNSYGDDGDAQFNDCTSLKVLILGASFDSSKNANLFNADTAPETAILDIYLSSADGTFRVSTDKRSDGTLFYPNNLLSGKVYHFNETATRCGTWCYKDNTKTDVKVNLNNHNFVNGKCSNCGLYDANGVIYTYVESTDSYEVTDYTGTDSTVIVYEKFNNGTNGEKPVTAVARRAFRQNKTIERVILPTSVTKIRNAAFSGCTNLVYVDAKGVTNLNSYSEDGDGQFSNCTSLKTLILGASFDCSKNANLFNADTAPETAILDIYLSSADGTFKVSADKRSDGTLLYPNNLLSGVVMHKDDSGEKCGTWRYNDDETDIVLEDNQHKFEGGVCTNCGVDQTQGIMYVYDSTLGGYKVFNPGNDGKGAVAYTGVSKEVYVRATYNDGTNDEKPVVAIGKRAFRQTSITKIILPASVTKIYNAAFSGCKNLTYVDASGVTDLNSYSDDGDAQFANCTALKTLILGASFNAKDNANIFNADSAPNVPVLNIYLSSADGTFKVSTNTTSFPNNLLSGVVMHKDDSGEKCGTWRYNDDKTGIVLSKPHEYENGACKNCDADQTKGLTYVYDETLDDGNGNKGGYVVFGGQRITAYTGTDKEVYIRTTYNDKPVLGIGKWAFQNNTKITKVIAPSVKYVGGVAFAGCTSLNYVDLRSFEVYDYQVSIAEYSDHGDLFRDCIALETLILGPSFRMDDEVAIFNVASQTAPTIPILDIFLSSADGTFKTKTTTNVLLSGDIYYYDEDGDCGTWYYNDDKTGIISKEQHTPDADTCKYCAARNYTVTAWGDSITFGEATTSNDKRYSNLLSEMLPINTAVNNQGLSGRKLIDEGVVDSIIADTSDVIIIALGTNDYAGAYNGRYGENAGLGKITDTDYANAESKTYYGALNALKEAFDKKDVKVIFLAPIGIHLGNQSQHGGSIADFGQAIKNVFGDDTTGKYTIVDGLEIISVSDIWNFSPDGVHVNDEAHAMIAKELFNAMKDIFGMSIRS